MKRLLIQYWICSLLAVSLLGCTAYPPAPVSSLNKDYGSVQRGSYRGSYYQVKKGDTLYFIAYITDKNVQDIIRYNDLPYPHTIYPGQKLKLWAPKYIAPKYGHRSEPVVVARVAPPSPPVSKISTTSAPSHWHKKPSQTLPKKMAKVAQKPARKKVEQSKAKEYVKPKGKKVVKKNISNTTKHNNKITKWIWPTKGRVIQNFSAGEQGNKGIDIAGQRGQPVVSTAAGTVVYSGNALRGYGNLIIVKHNENYLSAYAHNDRLLVSEGQRVKRGQKIATMGSSGTKSVRLHFEIRYQGKSVNPRRYLP